MAIETGARSQVRKVTVSLPVSLLDRLDDKVSPRQRSDFIARAIESQLAIDEQAAALDEAAGAWRDEDYPDLDTEIAMDRWLAELRGPAYRPDDDTAAPTSGSDEKSDEP